MSALTTKLNPARFTGMSGKMAAIVGHILDQAWTNPRIVEMVITTDGGVLARHEEDIGFNDFIGAEADLNHNWTNLLDCAGLTPEERQEAEGLFRRRVPKIGQAA